MGKGKFNARLRIERSPDYGLLCRIIFKIKGLLLHPIEGRRALYIWICIFDLGLNLLLTCWCSNLITHYGELLNCRYETYIFTPKMVMRVCGLTLTDTVLPLSLSMTTGLEWAGIDSDLRLVWENKLNDQLEVSFMVPGCLNLLWYHPFSGWFKC